MVDGDGDGYLDCEECDDSNATIHPLAAEVCDGIIDNNCDGVTDGLSEGCYGFASGCSADSGKLR